MSASGNLGIDHQGKTLYNKRSAYLQPKEEKVSEDKQPETVPAPNQLQQDQSYMNQVAENGKVRPLPSELIRKTRLGAQQPPCRPIQEEILDWDAIRVASSEPEAPKD